VPDDGRGLYRAFASRDADMESVVVTRSQWERRPEQLSSRRMAEGESFVAVGEECAAARVEVVCVTGKPDASDRGDEVLRTQPAGGDPALFCVAGPERTRRQFDR
jgi:hypothetical protein